MAAWRTLSWVLETIRVVPWVAGRQVVGDYGCYDHIVLQLSQIHITSPEWHMNHQDFVLLGTGTMEGWVLCTGQRM